MYSTYWVTRLEDLLVGRIGSFTSGEKSRAHALGLCWAQVVRVAPPLDCKDVGISWLMLMTDDEPTGNRATMKPSLAGNTNSEFLMRQLQQTNMSANRFIGISLPGWRWWWAIDLDLTTSLECCPLQGYRGANKQFIPEPTFTVPPEELNEIGRMLWP